MEKDIKNTSLIRKIISEEKGILPTTSTTFTTSPTLINEKKKYIYNIKGNIGISTIKIVV
jgi:hypothetical protein